MKLEFLGDCRNEHLVNELFGSVSAFACEIEQNGNNFISFSFAGKVKVKYDKKTDIHSFYLIEDE